MTKSELKKILTEKPGYFKKGKLWLSQKLGVSVEDIIKVFDELKKENKEYRVSNTSTKKSRTSEILEQQIESLQRYDIVNIKSTKDKEKSNNKAGIHIVIPCVHVPFENKKLIKALQEFIKDYKGEIKGFHILGDFIDMRSLSFHDRGNIPMMGITLGYEYKRANEVLDSFEEVLNKDIEKSYIWGNHEDRYNRLGNINEPSQYIDALPSPTKALRLKERGFKIKENWKEDYIQLGKIQLIHGIYCTATPAKKHLTVAKTSIMFAHTHRIDTYYETNNGAFNIGCLADINSDGFKYLSRLERLNWKNGFGLVHLESDGNFQADTIHCLNGSFFYGGKKY